MNMGEFKITCVKCGNEQTFQSGNKARGDDIDIVVDTRNDYSGSHVIGVEIHCENPECNTYVELDY